MCTASVSLCVRQVSVKFGTMERQPPKDDEVSVSIKAAGLNFRDVMLAISMLPVASLGGSAFGRRLGMEAAGVVTAVGKHVKDFKVGIEPTRAPALCGTSVVSGFGCIVCVRTVCLRRLRPLLCAMRRESTQHLALLRAVRHTGR